MATAETAKLIASLELRDKFSPTVKKAIGNLGALDSRIDRTASRGTQLGQHIGIGIQNAAKIAAIGVGVLVTNVGLGLNSLIKLEQAQAQTAAVLKSTGGAARITGEQVTALAEKYESLNATIGDEFIRAGENMLLTFTNIRGKAFEPALQSVLNLNTALGKGPEGLTKTAILVGKALNDPTKGLTALRRVGVAFTESQVDKIKSLQKEGKLYEAQRIILAELNKEFGGSFAAQGGTTAGKVAKFRDAIEDLQRSLAAGLLPVVSKVADRLSEFLQDPKTIAGVQKLADKLGALFSDEDLNAGANVLKGLFQTVRDVAPALSAAAKVTGQVVKTAVEMFTSLPKELQTLLVGGLAVNKLTGGLVTNIAGGLISSVLKQLVSGVVNVNGGVVNVTGAAGVGAGGVAGGGGKLGAILAIPIAGAIIAAAVPIGEAFAAALPASLKGPGGLGESESQRRIREGRAAQGAGGGFDTNKVIKVNVVNDRQLDAAAFRPTNQLLSQIWRQGRSQRDTLRAEHIKGAAVPDLGTIGPKLDKVAAGIGAVRDATKEAPATIVAAINNPNIFERSLLEQARHNPERVAAGLAKIEDRRGDRVTTSVEKLKGAAVSGLTNTKSAVVASAAVTGALIGLGTATTRMSGSAIQGSVRSGSGSIVAAVRAIPRPITTVNVNISATTVKTTVTKVERYGPSGDSSQRDSRYGPQPI